MIILPLEWRCCKYASKYEVWKSRTRDIHVLIVLRWKILHIFCNIDVGIENQSLLRIVITKDIDYTYLRNQLLQCQHIRTWMKYSDIYNYRHLVDYNIMILILIKILILILIFGFKILSVLKIKIPNYIICSRCKIFSKTLQWQYYFNWFNSNSFQLTTIFTDTKII